jgi:hypothetical protein
LGASQNIVLIKRLVSNLIYNLPKSLQRRDFHIPQIPPKEGLSHTTNPSKGGTFTYHKSLQRRDFHIPQIPPKEGLLHITSPSFGGI